METMKTIARRRSIRAYKPEQISEENLDVILSAGCAAPVGMAMYDTLHLTVVQDQDILKKISAFVMQLRETDRDPLYGAPTLILVSSKDGMPAPGIDYTNAACVLENMMLAAADNGIGSVIVWGAALAVEADSSLKAALSIPDGFKAISGAVFGYASAPDQTEKELKVTIALNRV